MSFLNTVKEKKMGTRAKDTKKEGYVKLKKQQEKKKHLLSTESFNRSNHIHIHMSQKRKKSFFESTVVEKQWTKKKALISLVTVWIRSVNYLSGKKKRAIYIYMEGEALRSIYTSIKKSTYMKEEVQFSTRQVEAVQKRTWPFLNRLYRKHEERKKKVTLKKGN